MQVADQSAGANCLRGGKKIESGLDTSGNGLLESGEVVATGYVCNGTAGTTGAQGTTGSTGSTGAVGTNGLVSISDEPAGTNCAYAGKKIESGLDANGDDLLGPGEITATSYVCNGATGGRPARKEPPERPEPPARPAPLS